MRDCQIYCPRCEWRPRAQSRWQCIPSCGTVWNTFWTGGVCPGCAYKWERTQCLACGELSPHADWYHYPDRSAPQHAEDIPATITGA